MTSELSNYLRSLDYSEGFGVEILPDCEDCVFGTEFCRECALNKGEIPEEEEGY